MPTLTPDSILRMVLYDPVSGRRVDVAGTALRRVPAPQVLEQYFEAGDGNEYLTRREHLLEAEVLDQDVVDVLRDMQGYGQPLSAVAISYAKHVLWYEPSRLQLITERAGAGEFATDRLRLTSRRLHPSVYQEANLLRALPWAHAEVVQPGEGEWLLRHPANPGGPAWSVAAEGFDIDSGGRFILSGAWVMTAEIGFPAPRARLQMDVPDGVGEARLEFLDTGRDVLLVATEAGGQEIDAEVPEQAFTVRTTFEAASGLTLAQPRLLIREAGRAASVEIGNVNRPPYWTGPGVVIVEPGENSAPQITFPGLAEGITFEGPEPNEAPQVVFPGVGEGITFEREAAPPNTTPPTITGFNPPIAAGQEATLTYTALDPDNDNITALYVSGIYAFASITDITREAFDGVRWTVDNDYSIEASQRRVRIECQVYPSSYGQTFPVQAYAEDQYGNDITQTFYVQVPFGLNPPHGL